MKKHSVTIRGHRTSFSLESEFWTELKTIAHRRQKTLAQLVTSIDERRGKEENLSSALRLYVLHQVKHPTD